MRLIDADALLKELPVHPDGGMRSVKDESLMIRVRETVKNAPTVNGWISVKDRLPEKNQIVIASDGEHTWDVGMYRSLCGKPSEWNWKKNTVKTVLWWMPKDGALPEPPKEDKDDD